MFFWLLMPPALCIVSHLVLTDVEDDGLTIPSGVTFPFFCLLVFSEACKLCMNYVSVICDFINLKKGSISVLSKFVYEWNASTVFKWNASTVSKHVGHV